ncbi:YiaA/YiaB family inner membrane protein [Thiothrix nivea]|uniref:YiaAB two helix domain-containing protein n=1 Tax=Thiothrix nivea (strain ATCC 35100 / DSM 5205 / JP2) TaxID=870187 RepID=A0A656HJK0_THINJ|nr:YiaA/YiaB family inner membrane protein [Thiothrix nivea]EIJ35419.1 YiaAB two helix domain-containing protein [Thiothrix nivea DSM 5205]
MNDNITLPNTAGWLFFVKLTFGISLAAMAAFIFFLEGNLLTKGYLALNSLFLVSATIMLSKTLRDEHEAQRLTNRINEAKTNKILKEFSE